MLDHVSISVIPHKDQRYETVGDWLYIGNSLHIFVSDMGNDNYHQLVAIHEYIEALLCRAAGIAEEDVTAFDKAFEEKRESGNNEEPGNDPKAPYYAQHQFATQIEKILSVKLGVDWETYDEAVNAL
ncbi:MAG TPA: hypothetical protein VGF75_05550 [Candidatus Saccharimonadales bacterium]|jgi:hypothetical protein